MKRNRTMFAILGLLILTFVMAGCGLGQNGSVSGTVLYEDGTKAADVDVQIGSSRATTDANGAFTLTKVKYGNVRLTVLGAGKSQTFKDVTLDEKELAVGEIIIPIVPAGNMFLNPTFAGAENEIPPSGWMLYGTHAGLNKITVVDGDDGYKRALKFVNGELNNGWDSQIGLRQDVPAVPGQTYRLTAKVKAVPGASPVGARLQLRFLPDNVTFQVVLDDLTNTDEFVDLWVEGLAPAGTTTLRVNLWTTYETTPQWILRQMTVEPVIL